MNKASHESVNGRPYWTVGHTPARATRSTPVHLLPIYDEYIVAYRDRDAVPHLTTKIASPSGSLVTFQHALVIDGKVAGTWRTARNKSGLAVNVIPLRRRLTDAERRGITETAGRYERFLGIPVLLTIE
jgi:hypothetical protein